MLVSMSFIQHFTRHAQLSAYKCSGDGLHAICFFLGNKTNRLPKFVAKNIMPMTITIFLLLKYEAYNYIVGG
jgi:hypothetical protein